MVQSSQEIKALFKRVEPSGATPIAARLEMLMLDYISKLEKAAKAGKANAVKPVNYIVLTDGVPSAFFMLSLRKKNRLLNYTQLTTPRVS